MGSAQLGIDEKPTEECLNAGSKQFLYIYGQLLLTHPQISLTGVAELSEAVKAGDAAGYLMRKAKSAP